MENYLIITLGTRDVQINKNKLTSTGWTSNVEFSRNKPIGTISSKDDINIEVKYDYKFPDELQLSSPRSDGEIIIEDSNFKQIEPILCLPIIEKTLTKLKNENTPIDKILLIYTNQQETEENGDYWKNDTIHFVSIVSRILISRFGFSQSNIDEFCISEKLTDIDFHYDYFEKEKNMQELLWTKKEDIEKVFLLPQGGIDQINQAISLRLIEYFKEKLVLFQQCEGNTKPKELTFPSLFLNNIKKYKIIELLKNYEFGLIDKELLGLNQNNKKSGNNYQTIMHLTQYADKRLNLRYNNLNDNLEFLKNSHVLKLDLPTQQSEKLIDLYLSAKINYRQGKGNEFLWKIFTLGENIFKFKLEEKLNFNSKEVFYKNLDNLSKYEKDIKIKANYNNFLKKVLNLTFLY